MVWADKRFKLGHGRAFALYVAAYTAGRFWIELMRDDTATLVFGVRVNVWVAALVFIGAVVYMILARKRGPREDLLAIREAHEAGLTGAAASAVDSDAAEADAAEGSEDAEPSEKAVDEEPASTEEAEADKAEASDEETRVEEAAERKS